MLNPLLESQLAKAGINPSAVPTPEQWYQLLETMSAIYTDYQTAEVELQQSELLYEELYDSTWRQTRELSWMVRVREALANTLELKSTLRSIVEITAESFGYALVSIYLLQGEMLYLQHQVGYASTIDQIPITKGIAGRVVRTGQAVLIEDSSKDPDFLPAINDLTSEVCVPIFRNGQVAGVLNIETQAPQRLTSNDLEMMTTLSEHVGAAMERAQLYAAVQESNQKYEMVVNNVHEVIFQLDNAGVITFLNKSWVQLSNYPLEESIGKHYSIFVKPDEREKAAAVGNLLLTKTQSYVRYPLTLMRRDSSQVPVEIHMQLVYNADDKVIGITGTIVDISERLQAEQQALDLMLKTRSVEALKGVLTGISHDLRTPLSVMKTSLYLLRHKMGDEENRYLDALDAQTVHMQRVIEDMLDMSKLDGDIAQLTPIRLDINGLIRDLLVTLENNAAAKNQHIIFKPMDGNPFIMADQFLLGKVITNVLRNGILYTPDGGEITIETCLTQEATLQIIVQDSGIGIDAHTLPHIFERFYKANAARPSGQGGTGLGLSIAHRIVEMHGGSIEAHSILGEGSTFIITLPIGQ